MKNFTTVLLTVGLEPWSMASQTKSTTAGTEAQSGAAVSLSMMIRFSRTVMTVTTTIGKISGKNQKGPSRKIVQKPEQ